MDTINLNEMFLDDNYSLESLLVKTQEAKLNLNDLRDKLIQHQQDLNQSSLELFNNSYDRFYKLSYIISCLAEPIQHVIDPIEQFKSQLEHLCLNHDVYLKEVNDKIVCLEDTSKNKELAKKLILLIKRRYRIENQMENIDWTLQPIDRSTVLKKDIDVIEYQIKCDLFERLCVELHHLNLESRAISPTHDELIVIKRSLETIIDKRQCQFDNWFKDAFLTAIDLQDRTMIDMILRTHLRRDSINKLDLVWRQRIVKPYLNLAITDANLTDNLSKTYEHLDQFIQNQAKLVQAQFIIKSFWQEVVESLERLDKFFLLNDLDNFQRRYNETRAFLHKQSQQTTTTNKTGLITESEADIDARRILSKFNLKGYFNHRLTQIASSVESSLSSNPMSEIPNNQDSTDQNSVESPFLQFKLKISMHIYALVTKCWSPELYIDDLEVNFVQLACKIINRFSHWLGKLRLSDFRIVGLSNSNRQTNFLAQQDAIMRLLLEDCECLTKLIMDFISKQPHSDLNLIAIRNELINDSFKALDVGLGNVRSLQRLIER